MDVLQLGALANDDPTFCGWMSILFSFNLAAIIPNVDRTQHKLAWMAKKGTERELMLHTGQYDQKEDKTLQ